MKKRIAAIMMIAVLLIASLTACGSSSSSIAGTYKLSTVAMEGLEISVKDFAAMMGSEEDVDMSITLTDNGTFTMDAMGESVEGTYEYKDSKLSLTAEGSTIDASYDKGAITVEESGVSMTFKK